MSEGELTGKVQTVLGLIDADSLGVTLPHEHLLKAVMCAHCQERLISSLNPWFSPHH